MPSKTAFFYELKESPYSFMYGDCTFFFSSRKHLSSFMDKICVRTQWLDDSMEKRFHFYVNMQLVAAFQLYFTVETRGCYVRLENGEELTCRENLRLNGLKASVRASTPQSEVQQRHSTGYAGESRHAQFMPEPVSYKEVKAEIKSARVLNNTVARLLRATRKGALDLTTVGEGGIVTRYEVREFQIAKAVNERRKSLRRKKLGIDYGQTLGRMGTLQQNNLLPDKRTARDLSPIALKRFIKRYEELSATSSYERLNRYYKNYIKGLDTVFGGYSEFDAAISQIARKIESMMKSNAGKLMEFFESGDELLNIEYIYAPEDRADKMGYILDRWAEL